MMDCLQLNRAGSMAWVILPMHAYNNSLCLAIDDELVCPWK